MAVQFQSSYFRTLWANAAINYVIDAVVIFIIASAFTESATWIAVIAPIAIYIITILWGLYNFGKSLLIYNIFDKKNQILSLRRDFEKNNLPPPEDDFYVNADEYLSAVTKDETATWEARIYASQLSGIIGSLRTFGPRTNALILNISLEAVLKEYEPKSV